MLCDRNLGRGSIERKFRDFAPLHYIVNFKLAVVLDTQKIPREDWIGLAHNSIDKGKFEPAISPSPKVSAPQNVDKLQKE